MYANSRRRKWNQVLLFLVSCHFVKYSISSPIFSSQFSQFQSARNLRNLPCVVRRSGLKGVCMFAIDCIKTNGTHLGTCIDKFYFGSCCQVKDVDSLYNIDLDDNRIDSSFPASPSSYDKNSASEKPYVRPVSSTSLSPSESSTTTATISSHFSSSNYKTSSKPAINYNNKTFELIPTTTKKTTPTRKKPSSISTTDKYSINAGAFATTLGTIVERNTSNTIKLKDEQLMIASSTESIKFTTFQSIQDSIKNNNTKSTTARITSTQQKTRPTKTSVTTKKPVTINNRTSVSSESTLKPTRRPIVLAKPSKNATTSTVIKATTRKPVNASTTIAVNRRTTITSRKNSTAGYNTIAKKPSTTSSASQLSTISYVETTRAPRPRPRPTGSITKVESSTLSDEDEFTTTFSVVSATDDKKTSVNEVKPPSIYQSQKPTATTTAATTTTTTMINSSTVKSPIVTRRPVIATRPVSSSITSALFNRRPITEPSVTTPSSIKASNITTSTAAIKLDVTEKPLNLTTQKIVEEIHQTTPSTIQQQQSTSSAGIITWTIGNEFTENTTKDEKWILLTSVTPSDTKASSIIDTIVENKIIATTPSQSSTTTSTESMKTKIDETTLENTGSDETSSENYVHTSQEEVEASSETISSEVGVEGGVDEDSEEDDDDENEETTIEEKIIESTTEFSQSTDPLTSASITQLSPNETQPISLPDDDDTTVNPELTDITNSSYDLTTPSSTTDDAEKLTDNSTTAYPTPSPTTMMNLEGLDYKQICGRRMFPEARIVGGSKSSFGRWPWQISLRQWRTSTYLHKCGSALLNENWAISAAHCLDGVQPSDLLLRLGEYDLSIEEEPYGYQERRVQIVASHPQFDPRTFEYDLALLRFYEPVVFQPNIIPVCVPESDEDFIGRSAHVTGWGRLYEDGPLPSVLQEVSVPVIKNDICEAMYRSAGYIEHIPHIFICAGWQKGGRDSCEDSGGPMVIQRADKRFQLAGIISWGIGCAEPNQPGVYTRISEFRDWINQILMF